MLAVSPNTGNDVRSDDKNEDCAERNIPIGVKNIEHSFDLHTII
jgi:hypothetical protein